MSFALIRLFLGGALKSIIAWLSHRSFWQLVCMGLGALLLVQHFQLTSARHSAAKWEHQFNAEHKARADDRAAYVKGQADAAAKNIAHNAKVEQHYQRNNDNEGHSYLDDLARLRAQRVRQATPAAQGAANGAGPSAPAPSIPRIDEAGLCVPATSDVCEAGAEIELRLMHLQNLFDLQAAVDPNAPVDSTGDR